MKDSLISLFFTRVMASIKDSSDKTQNNFEPQEVAVRWTLFKTGTICVDEACWLDTCYYYVTIIFCLVVGAARSWFYGCLCI